MHRREKNRKLSREKDQRRALLRTLASAFLGKEKIKTTEAKAKELSVFIERKITVAKKENLPSKRLLSSFFSPKIVKKLIQEIIPRYKDRKGGYTRIIRLGPRKSDGAKMVIIELIK
jgi:large subunit ribosomal protein L17